MAVAVGAWGGTTASRSKASLPPSANVNVLPDTSMLVTVVFPWKPIPLPAIMATRALPTSAPATGIGNGSGV